MGFFEAIIGDMSEKRKWKQMMKRAKKLPRNYREAFKKMQHYLFLTGCDGATHEALLELFEQCVADNRDAFEVIGSDVAGFCEQLASGSNSWIDNYRKKLNKEVVAILKRDKA
ncbi:MAG: DUF1048 domain-containing protein [Clostridia bacterium]|nr:DUF1048 domain-containing protein [Clostridia bacterium]